MAVVKTPFPFDCSVAIAVPKGWDKSGKAVGMIGLPKAQNLVFRHPLIVALTLLSLTCGRPGLAETSGAQNADTFVETLTAPSTDDLDGLFDVGAIRIATVFHPLLFSYDENGQPRGIVADRAAEFEKFLNENAAGPDQRIDVLVFPVPRASLLSAVSEGRADIADANITITARRAESVAFSDPIFDEISELVITGPAADGASTFDALVQHAIHAASLSSHLESLEELNSQRAEAGDPEIPIVESDPLLRDHDLLDLVDQGIVPAMVMDSHRADVWKDFFPNITVHDDLAVRTGGQIAWAMRQDAPDLLAAANAFIETAKRGTLLGNVLIKRYHSDPEIITGLASPELDPDKVAIVAGLTKEAEAYDFDWRMIVSQAYQESKLDPSLRSEKGAVGVMQILPSTAADPNVAIDDIHLTENNIRAGVKYLAFLRDRYVVEPGISPLDKSLLALAAYNAGPANLTKARTRAEELGFDPDVWFGNVEIAMEERIGSEPTRYVRNIFRYSVVIATLRDARAARDEALANSE